ncbi:bacterial Ig-like domain-containing protein [Lactiplantibacillus herbarum]|uniref:bacterial Ig-like domain-containing protein n=1 Tax=Lactiplantibacillus herbarum TaxID=1670446 RepID=UPI00069CDCCB|nr:bacterial Ig-like domain-containing protein [Lactiplantibacillus herbarum]
MGANNQRNVNTIRKEHYKMYKKGRNWLFAGIVVLSWQVGSINANADTTTDSSNNTNVAMVGSTTKSNANSAVSSSTATSTNANTSQDNTSASSNVATSKSAAASSATSSTATTASNATSTTSATSQIAKNTTSSATSSSSTNSNTSESAATGAIAGISETPKNTTSNVTSASTVSAAGTATTSTNNQVVTPIINNSNDEQNKTGNNMTTSTSATDTTNLTTGSAAITDQPVSSTEGNGAVTNATVNNATDLTPTDTVTSAASDNDLPAEELKPAVVTADTTAVMATNTATNDQQVINKRATLARAASDATDIANGTFGTSEWRIDSDGVLHLGAGTFADTTNIKSPWVAYSNQITAIDFDGKVVGSANSAGLFAQLTQLTTITNADQFDTSNVTNMQSMFMSDNALTSIDGIASWDTGKVTNMQTMFLFTSGLSSLNLSKWDVSHVTNMSLMFSTSGVTSIGDVSRWNTSNVTTMQSMFFDSKITTLDVSHWDTSHVTNMSMMFWYDSKIATLNVSNWNTSNVTTMRFMFLGASSIKMLDVSNWNVNNVTDMTNMFLGATSLLALDLSNWDLSRGQDITGMLANMTGLQTLVLGANTALKSETNNVSLPPLASTTTYTGKWVGVSSGQTYTSAELMAGLADGNNVAADTYIWQKAANASSQLEADDSTLVAGPKTTWAVKDNVVKAVDINGSDTTDDVTFAGVLDPDQIGVYNVVLYYVDSNGETVSKLIRVKVVVSQAGFDVTDTSIPQKPATSKSTWKPSDSFSGLTDGLGNKIDNADIMFVAANETTEATGKELIAISGDEVDNSKPGSYKVTYSYTDVAGNVITKTITVTVVGTKETLEVSDRTLTQNEVWRPESGMTSGTDFDGKPIDFKDVVVSGDPVDTSKPGTYQVIYTYTDKHGNQISKTSTVTVLAAETKADIVAKDTKVIQGSTWNAKDNFVSGTDADGNAISFDDVEVSGEKVDTSKPGTYKVTYAYTDKYGNQVSKTVTVTVVATKANIDVKDVTVTEGSSWNAEAGFVGGTDADGNAISFDDVKVSGEKVDTGKPGTYKVIYSYTDKYDNLVSKTVTVTVTAKDAGGDNNGNGGTDTGNNGNGNGGTDAGDNGNGSGSTDTDNNDNGNGDTDAGNNGNGNGDTDTGNSGNSNGSSDTNTAENDMAGNTNNGVSDNDSTTNTGNGFTSSDNYQNSSTTNTVVKLSAKAGGSAVDQKTKGQLPQTGETKQSSTGIMGLVLLGFSSLLALVGVKRRRMNK